MSLYDQSLLLCTYVNDLMRPESYETRLCKQIRLTLIIFNRKVREYREVFLFLNGKLECFLVGSVWHICQPLPNPKFFWLQLSKLMFPIFLPSILES